MIKEEGKSSGYIVGVVEVAFGIAEGATKEHGGAIADEGADESELQGRTVEVGEGGVDGVTKVDAGVDEFGVDEGAIEIKDDETGRHGGDCSGGRLLRIFS